MQNIFVAHITQIVLSLDYGVLDRNIIFQVCIILEKNKVSQIFVFLTLFPIQFVHRCFILNCVLCSIMHLCFVLQELLERAGKMNTKLRNFIIKMHTNPEVKSLTLFSDNALIQESNDDDFCLIDHSFV